MVVDTRTRAGRVAGVLGILTLMVGTLAACAGQSATSASPSVAPASPSASASTEPSASAASPSASAGEVAELPIEAKDFSFVAPASIEAGVTKVTVNNTGKEEHQAQVARIADGKTFADLTAALQQPDPNRCLAPAHPRRWPDGRRSGRDGRRPPPTSSRARTRSCASSSRPTASRTWPRGWSASSRSPARRSMRRFRRAMPNWRSRTSPSSVSRR